MDKIGVNYCCSQCLALVGENAGSSGCKCKHLPCDQCGVETCSKLCLHINDICGCGKNKFRVVCTGCHKYNIKCHSICICSREQLEREVKDLKERNERLVNWIRNIKQHFTRAYADDIIDELLFP